MIKKLLFGGSGGGSALADLGLLILRLFVGLAMALAHGYGKLPPGDKLIQGTAAMGFPAPTFFAWMAALSEFGGGILLAIGLATRLGAFLIACTMITAGFVAHASDDFATREKALLYLAIAVLFMLSGGGRYSVDRAVIMKSPA